MILREYEEKYLEVATKMFNLWDDIPNQSCEEIKATIDNFTKNTDNKLFIAFNDEEKAMGYIFVGMCYYFGYKPFLEIMQIMLDEEFRNKGYGKQMMDIVLKEYEAKGVTQVRLHSRLALTKAHKFYENYGFYEFKTSKFFIMDL